MQQYAVADSRWEFINDVIYHDYVTAFGYALRGRPWLPFMGGLFIWGKPGGTGLSQGGLLGGEKPGEQLVRFMRYFSDCRRQFGLKYLNHGGRLRDPQVKTDLPLIDRDWQTKQVRAIITSAWEAADGDVGCFFMNISNEPQTFEYVIDLSRCALDSMGTYTVTKHVHEEEAATLDERNDGKHAAAESLESGKVLMVQFSPRGDQP